MQTKQILTLAALSASLLPISAVHAQDTNTNAGSGGTESSGMSTMEVGEFRTSLTRIRDLFEDIRENNQLALASQDTMLASSYQRKNRRLSHQALGVLDSVTRNWKRIDTPSTNVETLGSRDMARFAAESDDTAFVRNTVMQLQTMLLSDKLNGRDPVVTSQMMDMLNAAITRAENPNFRVASSSSMRSRTQFSEFQWSKAEDNSAMSASSEQVASARTSRWNEATIEHENLPSRSQVAMADTTTTEEVMMEESAPAPERMGAADLPRTGGSPEILFMLGSSLMGAGGLLLRRRR